MKLQETFSAALLNPHTPAPTGIACYNGDIDRRFAVYRNNVQSGLINALATSYPVVAQLVGEAFFQAWRRYLFKNTHPTARS